MTNNLLRYKKDQKYIVFDYETEGLNLYYSKPFQLSFIIAQNKKIIRVLCEGLQKDNTPLV